MIAALLSLIDEEWNTHVQLEFMIPLELPYRRLHVSVLATTSVSDTPSQNGRSIQFRTWNLKTLQRFSTEVDGVAALRPKREKCQVIAPSSGGMTPSLIFRHNTAQGPLPPQCRNPNRNDLELFDQIRSIRSEVGANMALRFDPLRS